MIQAPQEPSPLAAARVWPIGLAGLAVFALAVLIHAPLKLDHDVSYFLASGRILNQGAQLYVDWVDFNTTAPSGLGRFSAWLAPILHTPLDITHKATLLSLILLGLGTAFAAALPVLRQPGPRRWVLAIGVPLVILFATPDVGRREHLMSVGILGWVISILLASSGARRPMPVAILAGVVAGFAIYMKPHFIFIAVAIGLVDLLRAKGRPDRLLISTWIAAGVSIALYAWLILANPDFLRVIMPATVDLYTPLALGWRAAAAQLTNATLPLTALLAATYILLRSEADKPPATAFAAATAFLISAAAIYIQQGHAFFYQRLPFDIGLNLAAVSLLAWGLGNGHRGAGSPRRIVGIAVSGLVLAIAFSSQLGAILRYAHRDSISSLPLVAALQPADPNDSFLFITVDVPPAAEIMTFIDGRYAGAFVSHFPIATLMHQNGRDGLFKPLPKEKQDKWTPWFRAKVADRFCAELPKRVAVDVGENGHFFENKGFDLLAWLREDPAFEACWIASGLQPAGEPTLASGWTYQVYASN